MSMNSVLLMAPQSQRTLPRFTGKKSDSLPQPQDNFTLASRAEQGSSPEVIWTEEPKKESGCISALKVVGVIAAIIGIPILVQGLITNNRAPEGAIAKYKRIAAAGPAEELSPNGFVTKDHKFMVPDNVLWQGFHKVGRFFPENGIVADQDNFTASEADKHIIGYLNGNKYCDSAWVVSPNSTNGTDPGTFNVTEAGPRHSRNCKDIGKDGTPLPHSAGRGSDPGGHVYLIGEAAGKSLAELPEDQQKAIKAGAGHFGYV